MALNRMERTHPNYRQYFNGRDIVGVEVFSDLTAGVLTDKTREKIGTVSDILVDDLDQVQYLAVDLGDFGSARRVLLPIDRATIDEKEGCVYASGLTRDQAEGLPAYSGENQPERSMY